MQAVLFGSWAPIGTAEEALLRTGSIKIMGMEDGKWAEGKVGPEDGVDPPT